MRARARTRARLDLALLEEELGLGLPQLPRRARKVERLKSEKKNQTVFGARRLRVPAAAAAQRGARPLGAQAQEENAKRRECTRFHTLLRMVIRHWCEDCLPREVVDEQVVLLVRRLELPLQSADAKLSDTPMRRVRMRAGQGRGLRDVPLLRWWGAAAVQ